MADGKHPGGRPSKLQKLSDEVRAQILAEIRRGAAPHRAAALADIAESTFFGWMAYEPQDAEPYASFRRAVRVAQRAWEADQESAISSAADWRARAWMLERRQRKEYGSEVKVEHAGSIGRADELGDDDLATIAAGGSPGAAETEAGEG